MAALLTDSEVLTLAFARDIDISRIPSGLTEAIQLKHLKPILQSDFYDALIAAPTSYTSLIAKIKPYLAHMVKYYIIPDMYVESTNSGVNRMQGSNRQNANSSELGILLDQVLKLADLFLDQLNEFLWDNRANYPLYSHSNNRSANIEVAGGIIFEKTSSYNIDND
jgi:hypothetical protein